MRAFVRLPRVGRCLHLMLLPAVSTLLILCVDSMADSGVSSNNVRIDTRVFLAGEVSVTMHRVGGVLLENGGPGEPVDDPLRISPNVHGNLAACPELPLLNLGLPADSGLVADGVTPLLFRVAANSSLTEPVAYDVSLVVDKSKAACTADLNGKLHVLAGGAWRQTRRFTLTPAVPYAYLMLAPVNAADIESNAGGMAKVIMTIRRENASAMFPASQNAFGIRKPPVVLVHGYNADQYSWKDGFRNVLDEDRGSDFVIAVEYGTRNDENTFGNLDDLTILLDEALKTQVERRSGATAWRNSNRWAWTRYDAVGHSQGGVLLRLLCSEDSSVPGLSAYLDSWAFRSSGNHHRGRFRRVVTIGSPHFGSTLAHLGYRLMEERIPVAHWGMENLTTDKKKKKLLQPKFRIDDGEIERPTTRVVSGWFTPDASARIHLLGASIFGGGTWPEAGMPGIYRAMYLHQAAQRGETLAPHGSDGVVDLRSQLAGTVAMLPGSSLARFSVISSSEDVSHADAHWVPGADAMVFGTWKTETNYGKVAEAVINLLNGDAGAFGPFPSDVACQPIYAEMVQVAAEIELMVTAIQESLLAADDSRFVKQPNAPDSAVLASTLPDGGPVTYAAEVINLTLQWSEAESPAGPAEWSVVVYGQDGISTQGLVLTTSGPFAENLRIDVAADVIGDIVASVRYLSVSGKTVIGTPAVVLSRPPGVLTAIEPQPVAVTLPAGPSVPLDVWGLHDSGIRTLLFTHPQNIAYTSDTPSVAVVDDAGQITLVAPGAATVSAIYSSTYTGTVAVTVLGPAPLITSTNAAEASVGLPFDYQITASGLPVAYLAEDLPLWLTLDPLTGLLEGTPPMEGRFHFTVGAVNAAEQVGRSVLALTVTGDNQPPADIGLDTESVPALQPAGSEVGRLATVDANTLDTHTYALVAGSGDTDNALFALDGNSLRTAAIIDPAVTPACSIRLRSTDSAGLSFEKEFVLPVAGAPVILEEPGDTRVFAGRLFALAVTVSGREPLAFQWQAADADLPGEHGSELLQTAGAPGTNTFRVLVSNALGVVTSAVAVVTVEPLSFGAWAAPHAEPGGPSIQPGGDINGDGVANWYDFAFGLASTQTVTALPQIRMTPEGPVFIHRRARHIMPLNYDIRMRPDLGLGDWSLFTPLPETVTVNPVDEGSEEIEIRIPIQDRIFLKLEVNP